MTSDNTGKPSNEAGSSRSLTSTYLILLAMPLFFSSNLIFGKVATAQFEPWTLAFLRWLFTALLLLPFVYKGIGQASPVLRKHWKRLLLMGFLGMWICGAIVYLALRYTTATNGTLIYTSSPVLIVLLERIFRGRKSGWREAMGISIALIGVVAIVLRGNFTNLVTLNFNSGDLLFVLTAISWAIYSLLLKSEVFDGIPTLVMFAVIAFSGALGLAPFAIGEMLQVGLPTSADAWTNLAGIVFFSSLLAFSAFQHGVRMLGASLAGVFMYFLPVYGVGLAVLFLGEEFQWFHLLGILMVSGGVVLATFPARLLQSKRQKPV